MRIWVPVAIIALFKIDEFGVFILNGRDPDNAVWESTPAGDKAVLLHNRPNHRQFNFCRPIPVNTKCWRNAWLMLGQRRRRWANIMPALGQLLVFFLGLIMLSLWAANKMLGKASEQMFLVFFICFLWTQPPLGDCLMCYLSSQQSDLAALCIEKMQK